MSKKEQELPEVGELVLITITKVHPHCAFAKLDEYGAEGMIHVSELTSSWVRNIRNYVKEGKHDVAKVIRVDPEKMHINLSLKRVSDKEKRDKASQIKRSKKAVRMMKMLADSLKLKAKEKKKLDEKMMEAFGEVYFAFEEAKRSGVEELEPILGKKTAKAIHEIAEKNVTLPTVTVSGIISVTSPAPNGVEVVKKVLSKAIPKEAKTSYLGAPRFKITLEGGDYKGAEKRLLEIVEKVKEAMGSDGSVEFEKE